MKPIIAIDGPAASGKGTLARMLGEHFHFMYLDSGKFYRAFACIELILSDKGESFPIGGATPGTISLSDLFAEYTGIESPKISYSSDKSSRDFSSLSASPATASPSSAAAPSSVAAPSSASSSSSSSSSSVFSLSPSLSSSSADYDFFEQTIKSGRDLIQITDSIPEHILKSEAVGMAASNIAKNPRIRELITRLIRDFAVLGSDDDCAGIVMDGRDIGSVVFPDATCKIFMTADLEVRAKRRFKEMLDRGKTDVDFDAIYAGIKLRDEQDSSRGIAPMTCDETYIRIDTTSMTIQEAFDQLVKIVNLKLQ